ncbi:hypothetical protein B0A48_06148 [Cryoendolithus antarcticus]|uniref:Armadillo-like helical domain-containing protein n=1 Tax=Cryoendolithus antarcticus TaxID=1507870 RepID=A0A1V8TAM2_9PEZI|nr:hypothetical protein B0A48_06148 [Cryoendolithus antarcticus]
MDIQSPLTQQTRPDVFEAKVVSLYRQIFRGIDDFDHPDGFWHELFLLKPDLARLRVILDDADAEYLIHVSQQTRELLIHAVAMVEAGNAPSDEHALDTLTVFFSVLLTKKYTNPSSDIIEILAGLDNADVVFARLVAALEQTLVRDENSTRLKAVDACIAIVSGGFQTVLVSYFLHRDLVPALYQLCRIVENPLHGTQPLTLIGLLTSYEKYEVQGLARLHSATQIDDDISHAVVEVVGWTCVLLRDRYVAILDDAPVAWSVGGTLSYIGLGALAGAKPPVPILSDEEQKALFVEQPGSQAASFLTLLDLASSNQNLRKALVSAPAADKERVPAFSALLSYTSYLFQNAYRSTRASSYAHLTTLILLALIDDTTINQLICDTVASVRLCRQRPPLLPTLLKPSRSYAAAILDICIDAVNHNLRKRLDVLFYRQNIALLTRLLEHLIKSHTKLVHHWQELWRSLLSFVRFLTSYAEDLKALPDILNLVGDLVDLLAVALANGEAFMPDTPSFDDLFYKLVESGEALTTLRIVYGLAKPDEQASINTLIGVSKHYQELIDEHHKGRGSTLSPKEVSKIIKMGYDTLPVAARDAHPTNSRSRGADGKAMMKRVVRVAVADAASLVG